jgi:hypothetical protein
MSQGHLLNRTWSELHFPTRRPIRLRDDCHDIEVLVTKHALKTSDCKLRSAHKKDANFTQFLGPDLADFG